MPRRSSASLDADLLQGTLDLLVLQTLQAGPAHGHTIAHVIEHRSDALLQVQHGSLYPALHRLEDRGWVASFWGTSENNRKARYYRLNPAGRRQPDHETSSWDRFVRAARSGKAPVDVPDIADGFACAAVVAAAELSLLSGRVELPSRVRERSESLPEPTIAR